MNADESPVIILRGERVGLGPLRRELVPLYHRWLNDLVVQRTTRHPRVIPLGTIEAGMDQQAGGEGDTSFTVYELESDAAATRPVGLAGLKDVDFRNRLAEFEIVIGAPDARGKGLGTATTRLVLDYAFNVLSLRNVMLTVYANNPAGIRAYEKAGFKTFGRRTAAVEVAGQFFDVIFMEALPSDFDSPVARDVLLPPGD